MLSEFLEFFSGLLSIDNSLHESAEAYDRRRLIKERTVGGNIDPVLYNGRAILKNEIEGFLILQDGGNAVHPHVNHVKEITNDRTVGRFIRKSLLYQTQKIANGSNVRRESELHHGKRKLDRVGYLEQVAFVPTI
jgi:hypothetical protein